MPNASEQQSSGTLGLFAPDLRRVESHPSRFLGLFRFSEMAPLEGFTGLVDWRLQGFLSRLVMEGFIGGGPGECLLFPLDGRLPQEHLLLVGLGEREGLDREAFHAALGRMFAAVEGLGAGGLALPLPGRVEGACDAATAIEWFLEFHDRVEARREVTIIELGGAQKVMLPAIERRRLRRILEPAR